MAGPGRGRRSQAYPGPAPPHRLRAQRWVWNPAHCRRTSSLPGFLREMRYERDDRCALGASGSSSASGASSPRQAVRLFISVMEEKPGSGDPRLLFSGAPAGRPSLSPWGVAWEASCAAAGNLLLVQGGASTSPASSPSPGPALTHGLGDLAHPICDLLQPRTCLSQGARHLHPHRDRPPTGKESLYH